MQVTWAAAPSSKFTRVSGWCRYTKGLPPNVVKMNTECLKLRPHDHPGYQTIAQIKVSGSADPELLQACYA